VNPRFVVVRRFQAVIHAQLAKGALEACGIDVAMNAGLMGLQGVPVGAGTIDLLVRQEDVEIALEILGPGETFSS
jgi:hypothetical protein